MACSIICAKVDKEAVLHRQRYKLIDDAPEREVSWPASMWVAVINLKNALSYPEVPQPAVMRGSRTIHLGTAARSKIATYHGQK